jgi:hypothetical protein
MVERRKTKLRERAVSFVRELSNRWLERWRTEQQPYAEAEYRQSADRFIALGNGFLARLKSAGLTGLPTELSPEIGFRTKSRLYYTSLVTHAPFTLRTWIFDRIRSRQSTMRSVERAASEYLEKLLSVNTSRIVGELIDQMLESRRWLEADLRKHIRNVFTTAERALDRARTTQADGSRAVEAEIARLDALEDRVRRTDEPQEGRDGP